MKILVVVDMQNDFINGALGTPEALAIVPYVKEVIQNFNGKVLFTARVATDRQKTEDEYASILSSILQMRGVDPEKTEGGILSSVVPPLNSTLLGAAETITGKKFLQVSPALETGLTLKVDNPTALGSDRIVDAVAACAEYPLPLIVFDLGTCTTVSVVDAEGAFRGGVICAGVRISQEALTSQTSQLPGISLDTPRKVIGRNTVDSMRSGAILGTAAMVDGLIDRIRREMGIEATVVMTGGMGRRIYPSCRRDIHYDGDLLLKGLWILYQKNRGAAL